MYLSTKYNCYKLINFKKLPTPLLIKLNKYSITWKLHISITVYVCLKKNVFKEFYPDYTLIVKLLFRFSDHRNTENVLLRQ